MERRRSGACGLAWVVLLAATAASARAGEVRTIEIAASRFQFEPSTIEVDQGDEVRLVAHSLDTTHGLVLKAFGVQLTIPKGGEAVSASFVASQPGRFPFACSEYCGSGHRRMTGELIVRGVKR